MRSGSPKGRSGGAKAAGAALTVRTPVAQRILRDVLSIPTAPFAEHQVIAYIERFCKQRGGVTLKRDRAGNVLVRVRKGSRKVRRPVCITAHVDHPGFVADKMLLNNHVQAFWRGGVPPQYFVLSKIRFDIGGTWVRGIIRSALVVPKNGQSRVDTVSVKVPRDIPRGAVGMWDFPDPVVRGSRIYARGCDDLAGVAAMLSAIHELSRAAKSCEAYFLFTRAEEVGFIGAIAACRLRTIPSKCIIVAMETSSERPFAKMGDGPILRVGDRASTFTHAATAYCHRAARELARDDSSFKYQRKLMDGGTCESSAYCALGYEATGICIALGNYHNVDAKKEKLAPEYIDLSDYDNVVKWFVELGRSPHRYTGRDETLDEQLAKLERDYRRLLRETIVM
jgi:endoglucanase